MGGQGFIPEDGEGGLVEGAKEAKERRKQDQFELPHGAAPRAGMQGQKERGAAPTPTLERPGTTPAGTPGSGGGIGKTGESEPPREGGRVQDPKTRNTP
ncbi:MAG: hypothetical protein ACXWLR_05635 [Myxococcales bacterium]